MILPKGGADIQESKHNLEADKQLVPALKATQSCMIVMPHTCINTSMARITSTAASNVNNTSASGGFSSLHMPGSLQSCEKTVKDQGGTLSHSMAGWSCRVGRDDI